MHGQLQTAAASAVNQSLTIRNWLIGYYIVEFEQNGEDRAVYGDKLIEKLAVKLNHIKGIDVRSLRKFRQFYILYPQVEKAIRGSVTPELEQDIKVGSATPLLEEQLQHLQVPPQKIISKLSYTRIRTSSNCQRKNYGSITD